ncbi:hypothetical protein LINPERHAP2_LOCUS26011 [Linum perenne]
MSLTKLLEKNVAFVFDEASLMAFEHLERAVSYHTYSNDAGLGVAVCLSIWKERLAITPILTTLDWELSEQPNKQQQLQQWEHEESCSNGNMKKAAAMGT